MGATGSLQTYVVTVADLGQRSGRGTFSSAFNSHGLQLFEFLTRCADQDNHVFEMPREPSGCHLGWQAVGVALKGPTLKGYQTQTERHGISLGVLTSSSPPERLAPSRSAHSSLKTSNTPKERRDNRKGYWEPQRLQLPYLLMAPGYRGALKGYRHTRKHCRGSVRPNDNEPPGFYDAKKACQVHYFLRQ